VKIRQFIYAVWQENSFYKLDNLNMAIIASDDE